MTLSQFDAAWRRSGPHDDSMMGAALIAAGAISLGYALQRSNGTLESVAFQLTAGVLVAGLLVLVLGRTLSGLTESFAVLVCAVGAVVAMVIHLTTPPGIYLRVPAAAYASHHQLVAAAALIIGGSFVARPYLRSLHVPLLLALHFALGLWLLNASPAPIIDVWVWHNDTYRQLAQGLDPYALTMTNIYGHTRWFAPGMADATHVFVGYPYPPVTLLLGGVGNVIAGDYRYANLAAITLTGACIAYARPGRLATLAAAIFLFTPRGMFVLEQGWTEALSTLLLSATVLCACRFPKALPWVFGATVGAKQYFVFAVPLTPLLLGTLDPKTNLRFIAKAAILPVAVTVPFVLWNPTAFFDSVVAFQAKQPFRADALSVLAFTAKDGTNTLPLNLSFVAALPPLLLGLWRAPRTPSGFALTFAVTLLSFFFFAKQAFTNYYFLVVGGLCVAFGAALNPSAPEAPASTPGAQPL